MTERPAEQHTTPHCDRIGILLGLLADTHGVYDPAAATTLKGAHLLLHAGDVGHHGGHAEVLKAFADATCSPVLAVAGNVDDAPGAAQLLPPHRVVDAASWRLLLVHVVAPGPGSKVDARTAALIAQHQPDLVVCGHSHKAAHWQAGGVHFINPGSAGPARFKLARSVAKLWLPPKPHAGATLELVEMRSAAAQPLPAAPTDSAGTAAQEGTQLQESEVAGGADSSRRVEPARLLCAVDRESRCQGCLEVLQLPQKAPPRLQASRRQ